MRRKLLLLSVLMVVMLTGCSMDQAVTIHGDLSSSVVMDTYTTEKEETEIMASLVEMGAEEGVTFRSMMEESGYTYEGTKEIDGVKYNQYSISDQNTAEETKNMFAELTKSKAVYDISSDSQTQTQEMSENSNVDMSGIGFCNLTMTFPFKVAKTNGELQPDGCTVKFDILEMQKKKIARAYALSASALAKSDTVTFKGVKNKKAYKKPVTVKATSKGVITSFAVNGKVQSGNSYYAKKNGKYKVVVTTASGKKFTRTFWVDSKKPTTNIKNNKTYKKNVKITFKDKNSGIKKATLNGKKIKTGKKVKKNGKYVLKIYDKAGNVKTVKFTIKK